MLFVSIPDHAITETHLYLSLNYLSYHVASHYPSKDNFSYEKQKFFDATEPWHLSLNYRRKMFNMHVKTIQTY